MTTRTPRDRSARSRRVLSAAVVLVVVALFIGAVVALTSSHSPTGTVATVRSGPRNFPGATSPQALAFRSCLQQHGVTLPAGGPGGFGGGVPPDGGTPPTGGTGPGRGFGAGNNSKVGRAVAACRTSVGAATPA